MRGFAARGNRHDWVEDFQMKLPRLFWRLFHFGPRIAYAGGLGPLIGKSVLLLTTLGRKSGLRRITPLVYEKVEDAIVVASARGQAADWLGNIMANPKVSVRVGRSHFDGVAEVTCDAEKIADYLQRQLERNPAMFGAILRAEGLSPELTRAELVRFAPKRPMVIIRATNVAT
jgi:deazaflavin-dependent oxidoreductase (nitroreductase family)